MAWLPARELRERLRAGLRFLADGGVGTELMRHGVAPHRILRTNSDAPDLVRDLHRRYLSAGAQILTANTFGVGEGAAWGRAVRAGWELAVGAARESADGVFVWLSLAPGTLPRELETLRALAAETPHRPDALLLETNTSLAAALEAVAAARSLRPELLAVTCHFRAEGRMPDGTTPETAACALSAAGAHLLGGNCGDAPEAFVGVAERMRAAERLVQVNLQRAGYGAVARHAPLLFQPNAGLPLPGADGGWTYPAGPAAFAEAAALLLDAGVAIVGGCCCGTTPAHIAAVRERCFGV